MVLGAFNQMLRSKNVRTLLSEKRLGAVFRDRKTRRKTTNTPRKTREYDTNNAGTRRGKLGKARDNARRLKNLEKHNMGLTIHELI